MRIEEISEDCEDVYDFNCIAEQILEEYCDGVQEMPGTTRPFEDGDPYIENCSFLWTDPAQKLIEAKISDLYEIGRKYFKEGVDIFTPMYKEE